MDNTIRFGSACGPCKTPAAERAQIVEDIDDKEDLDPNRLLPCPFDKNHQIRACRFPYHLVKCKKNHPKLASEMKTCPFNARHLVTNDQLAHHIETCKNRKSWDDGITDEHRTRNVPVSTWVNTNLTEDWDKEIDDYAPVFVWGESTDLTLKLDRKSPKSPGLGITERKTFPWLNNKK